MRSITRVLVGLAIAGLALGQGSAASAATGPPDPGDLDHFSVLTDFPPGEFGTFAESMAPDGRGGMIVSVTTWGDEEGTIANTGQLWRVRPDGSASEFGPQMDLSPSGMLMGVAVDEQGRVYVALNNFGSEYGMAEDPPSGVLRVTPGTALRVLTLPDDSNPNGLAECAGTLFVADSLGSIWTASTTGAHATAEPWFTSPLLEPGSYLGANGIACRKGSVYVTSYDQGLIVRIPIERTGVAGAATVVADHPSLIGADGITFDRSGQLWVAVNGEVDWESWSVVDPGRIVVVSKSGEVTQAQTPEGSLDYPTALVIGDHGSVYVSNGSFLYGEPTVGALRP